MVAHIGSSRRLWLLSTLVGFLVVTVGCTPKVETHGHVLSEDRIEEVKPGIHTRTDVTELLGSPSDVATFHDATWYYITKRVEKFAFFNPKVLDQQVVVVKFEYSGFVEDVVRYDLADGQVIEPVARETATRGKELGFFEQLLGNVGRFTKSDDY
jgi:outer membrane protein assembly factor BamE (lipoprotein component of BamABCDE complex)